MVACSDAMRLRFRNKHQKIELFLKQLAVSSRNVWVDTQVTLDIFSEHSWPPFHLYSRGILCEVMLSIAPQFAYEPPSTFRHQCP